MWSRRRKLCSHTWMKMYSTVYTPSANARLMSQELVVSKQTATDFNPKIIHAKQVTCGSTVCMVLIADCWLSRWVKYDKQHNSQQLESMSCCFHTTICPSRCHFEDLGTQSAEAMQYHGGKSLQEDKLSWSGCLRQGHSDSSPGQMRNATRTLHKYSRGVLG